MFDEDEEFTNNLRFIINKTGTPKMAVKQDLNLKWNDNKIF